MNDEQISDAFSSAAMNEIESALLEEVAIADTGKGAMSVYAGDGIFAQAEKTFKMDLCIYTPKTGEVFACVVDAKIRSIVLSVNEDKTIFSVFEQIELDNCDKRNVFLSFQKTEKTGVFHVIGSFLEHSGEGGTYIRVNPDLWAKAMKYRNMYIASVNALFNSVDPDKPFIE